LPFPSEAIGISTTMFLASPLLLIGIFVWMLAAPSNGLPVLACCKELLAFWCRQAVGEIEIPFLGGIVVVTSGRIGACTNNQLVAGVSALQITFVNNYIFVWQSFEQLLHSDSASCFSLFSWMVLSPDHVVGMWMPLPRIACSSVAGVLFALGLIPQWHSTTLPMPSLFADSINIADLIFYLCRQGLANTGRPAWKFLRAFVHRLAHRIDTRWDDSLQFDLSRIALPRDCKHDIMKALRGQDKLSATINSFLGAASGFGRRADIAVEAIRGSIRNCSRP
jgi:hypothetical protein